jgi:hypothetical protein
MTGESRAVIELYWIPQRNIAIIATVPERGNRTQEAKL